MKNLYTNYFLIRVKINIENLIYVFIPIVICYFETISLSFIILFFAVLCRIYAPRSWVHSNSAPFLSIVFKYK